MMKKNTKIILFSLIGLVVLGGAFLVLYLTQPEKGIGETEPKDSEKEEIITVFTDYTAEDVVSVYVENKNDSGYTILSGLPGFSISELDEKLSKIPYHQDSLSGAANAVAGLSANKTVEENADDLEKYGLGDECSASVSAVFKDGTVFDFLIGDFTPDFSSYYFRLADNNDVYAVPSSKLNAFLNNRYSYISRITFPEFDSNNSAEISKIKIERADWDKSMVIESIPVPPLEERRTFNTHKLTSPISIEIDQDKSRSIMYSIFGLGAMEVSEVAPDEEMLKTVGMNEPSCQIEEKKKKKTYTLTLGHYLEKDGAVAGWFGMSSHVPDILFLFDSAELPWIYTSVEKLIAEMFLSPYIYSVDTLAIELGDSNTSMTFAIKGDADDNWVLMNGEKISNRDAFGSLYQYTVSVKGEDLFFEELDDDSQRIAKITYVYRDKSQADDVIEYYTTESRKSIIRVNGENVYKCKEIYATRLVENVEAFLSGGEIINDW